MPNRVLQEKKAAVIMYQVFMTHRNYLARIVN